MSTFNGKIARTPIIVDNFQPPYSLHSVRFLSHLHTDHIKGLSSDYPGLIYCSEVTKILLIHKFNFLPSKIVTLEENVAKGVNIKCESFDVVSNLDELANDGENKSNGNFHFVVTAFAANHCPGSLMFFFEGEFGNALYSGDFRYSREMMENTTFSQRVVANVDTLFLDTTFSDPLWVFPTRLESIQLIFELIKKFDKKNLHEKGDVYIECEMLGTEIVLVQIATEFATQVYVDDTKFREYEKYIPETHKYFTTNQTNTRFYGCRHKTFTTLGNNISPSKLPKKPVGSRKPLTNQQSKNEHPYLCIKPSAQWFSYQDRVLLKHCLKSPYKAMDGVWHVLFSIHSSFGELEEFVKWVCPKSLTPTVTPCHKVGFSRLQSHTLGDKTESKGFEDIVKNSETIKMEEKRKISLDESENEEPNTIQEEDMDSFYSTLIFSSTLGSLSSMEEIINSNENNNTNNNNNNNNSNDSTESETFESTVQSNTANEATIVRHYAIMDNPTTTITNKTETVENKKSKTTTTTTESESNSTITARINTTTTTTTNQEENNLDLLEDMIGNKMTPTLSEKNKTSTPALKTPQKKETKIKHNKITPILKSSSSGPKKRPHPSKEDDDDGEEEENFLKILSKSNLRCHSK